MPSDNGAPFASTGIGGLSRLSVWWIWLDITPEQIAPGHPEQNGRRERGFWGEALARETVGVKEREHGWRVRFAALPIAWLDADGAVLERLWPPYGLPTPPTG